MFIKTSLAPLSSRCTKAQPMEPSPFFSNMAWYSEGGLAQTEKQETGSDASTADTSPYFPDEAYYADTRNADIADMAWHGCYPPMTTDMPFPDFGLAGQREHLPPPWQLTGWGDFQGIPMPEVLTAGSSKHRLGQCKPCAFAWKPEGCQSGAQCQFCHLCPPGEKQRRKKVLRQLQRSVGISK